MPLQANWPGYLVVDNLNVLWSIARLLEHGSLSKPLPLGKDGGLIAAVQHMFRVGGLVLFKLLRVRVMPLRLMWIRAECRRKDGLGNVEADTAADLGGRHQSEAVVDNRRALVDAWEHWYPSFSRVIGS